MKKQINQLRRFLTRTKTYNASAARAAAAPISDDDDGGNRLSGAFIVVLLLHVIAVVGVFAFAKIKENRQVSTPPPPSVSTGKGKGVPEQPAPKKPAPAAEVASVPPVIPPVPRSEMLKSTSAGQRGTYIVRDGDTLGRIALAYKVGVADLVAANRLRNQDDIREGKELIIPQPSPTPKVSAVPEIKPRNPDAVAPKPPVAGERQRKDRYIVQKGDNASKIAREKGCSLEELVKLNNIKDPTKLQPGQPLKLPPKKG